LWTRQSFKITKGFPKNSLVDTITTDFNDWSWTAIYCTVQYKHEANIQSGGKNVHVGIIYLSRNLLVERGGVGGVTPPPYATTLFPSWPVDISFKDDVTIILLFPSYKQALSS
jgi:hypothetical protein